MDMYLIVAAGGSLCCLVLGIYVLLQDYRKTLNRLFFLISLTLGGLVLEGNLIFVADTLWTLISRYRLATFFYAAWFALNFHLYIAFTGWRPNPWKTILIYVPALVVFINTFIGQSIFAGYVHNDNTWDLVPAYGSFGFYYTIVYITVYVSVPIILMERYRRKTDLNKEKRQAIIVNSAYFLTMTFASTSMLLFPVFGIYSFSRLSPNAYLIYCFAIFYAVFKLKFLKISPSIMVDEIIDHIGEMILILENDGRIIMGNTKSLEFLESGPENLKQKFFLDIIRNNKDIHSRIDAYLKSDEKSLSMRINYTSNGGDAVTDTYISRIYDKFGDPSGFLVISKENKGKRQVQKAYKITDREFEVVELLLSGFSNKMIGEQLGISVRTVESHCLHIYNKIDIKDRIELFKFANEFNLLPKPPAAEGTEAQSKRTSAMHAFGVYAYLRVCF